MRTDPTDALVRPSGLMLVHGLLYGRIDVEVRISDHALQRYRERVRDQDADVTWRTLVQLFELCPILPGVPVWTPGSQRSLFHLAVGDTVMIALDPDPADRERLLARTALTTGAFSRRRRPQRRERSRRGRFDLRAI